MFTFKSEVLIAFPAILRQFKILLCLKCIVMFITFRYIYNKIVKYQLSETKGKLILLAFRVKSDFSTVITSLDDA